ncbi:hypothetical protein RA224_08550 [Achromobacter aegrifaciens]|uniref:hypothetical protein n=1 Tax=Achromobacter aegrifaciens TaxID=1287736 RepID=UPI0027BAE4F5|nr:hypothetical protein [Achromobacter aegrifaciens]WLW63459.1 hypothetical protein RA224_08550 [Achromobacter aegrifaciens]
MKTRVLAIWLQLLLAIVPVEIAFGQPADSLSSVSPAVLKRVDQEAEAALSRLYLQSRKAQALVARSFGVLVVPALHADGGILGMAYGRGVLIDAVGGRSYYNAMASPPGSVLGLDGKALILFFSNYEALRAFQAAPGWVEGESGTIQVLDETAMAGRNLVIEPIAGFILSDAGLVRGLALKGILFIKVPVFMCAQENGACDAAP